LKTAPISIVLPTYNHARYLGRSLSAILGQSVPPMRVVVVDDGSEDDTADVLAGFAAATPCLSVLRNPQNSGPEISMARGLATCSTPYFCAVSSTDELLPTFLERMVQWIERYPESGLYLSDFAFRPRGSGSTFPKHIGLSPRAGYIGPEALCRALPRAGYILPAYGCIFRTEAVWRAGGFDPALRWHADWFTELIVAFRHGICYVPEPLAIADVAPGNYSSGAMRSTEQAAVLRHLLELVVDPRYADVAPLLHASGALAYFGADILRAAQDAPGQPHSNLPRAASIWRSTRSQIIQRLPLWARAALWRARYALHRPRSKCAALPPRTEAHVASPAPSARPQEPASIQGMPRA
jgi:hypothetical protein